MSLFHHLPYNAWYSELQCIHLFNPTNQPNNYTMKKISILLVLLATLAFNSYSQCDKKVILTSSTTEHLNGDSTVERTEIEHTQIEFDKNTITIVPGSEDHTMTGSIKSISCNWSIPFKEGKTVLKV